MILHKLDLNDYQYIFEDQRYYRMACKYAASMGATNPHLHYMQNSVITIDPSKKIIKDRYAHDSFLKTILEEGLTIVEIDHEDCKNLSGYEVDIH
jgi:hypothetical protein